MVNIIEMEPYPDLVDMTCFAFPMYVAVAPYLGSLRIDELDQFLFLEETGGVELAKFDLQRGIILDIKISDTYNLCYFKYIRDVRRDHPILHLILDPIIYSYPNEKQGNEPAAQLSLVFDGQQVLVAGTIIPYFVDQEIIRYCEVISLPTALLLLDLVYNFTGLGTDNGYRALNY